MSNAPPGVIDALKNFVQQQNGNYPTVPPNPSMTTAARFVAPPPSMQLPYLQGGAPPLNPIAAMGNPDIAERFQQAQPGPDPNHPPDVLPPDWNRFLMGNSSGLLG